MLIAKTSLPTGHQKKFTEKKACLRAKTLNTTMILVIGSVVSLSTAGSALADPARIKSKSLSIDTVFQQNTVRVISSGHEKFDAIEGGGNIKLWVRGHVDPKGLGRVMVGGFLLGWCGGAPNCSQFTVRYIDSASMEKKKWSFDHELNIPTDLISHSGPSGIAPYPDGDRLIQSCNNAMNGQGPVEAVTLDSYLTVSASAYTHKWKPFDGFFGVTNWNETHYGGDVGVSDTFPVKVECVPSEELLSQPIAVSNRAVDTASGDVGACPRRVEHSTSIYYRRPTTATFKIKQNGSVVRTVERSTEAQSLSDGTTQHVIHYDTELTSPEGNNNYRVKVVSGPESNAVQLNIDCSAFDITFADLSHAAPDNGKCPRQVWQTSSFITNGPGSFTYELRHKLFGVIYEKEVEAQLFDGIYKAVDTRVIQLIEGETEFLAQVKGSDGINTGWQSINIECEAKVKSELTGDTNELTIGQNDPGLDMPKPTGKVNPLVGGAAIGGLIAPRKPTHANPKPDPQTPITIVDPKPAPKKQKPEIAVCKNGKIRNSKCYCPKSAKQIKISRFEYICKALKIAAPKKPKKPVRANPNKKKVDKRTTPKKDKVKKNKAKRTNVKKKTLKRVNPPKKKKTNKIRAQGKKVKNNCKTKKGKCKNK